MVVASLVALHQASKRKKQHSMSEDDGESKGSKGVALIVFLAFLVLIVLNLIGMIVLASRNNPSGINRIVAIAVAILFSEMYLLWFLLKMGISGLFGKADDPMFPYINLSNRMGRQVELELKTADYPSAIRNVWKKYLNQQGGSSSV